MRWLPGLLVGGLLASACGKTVYRSYEGQYCSSTEDDDPYFECSPSYDLVCTNTYDQQVRTSGGEAPRFQEIFLCRTSCNPGESCLDLRDVCCVGPIYGKNYGKSGACVPAAYCQKVQSGADGGLADRPRDTAVGTSTDTNTDTPVVVDAPADAPAPSPDLGSDAPTADAGVDSGTD